MCRTKTTDVKPKQLQLQWKAFAASGYVTLTTVASWCSKKISNGSDKLCHNCLVTNHNYGTNNSKCLTQKRQIMLRNCETRFQHNKNQQKYTRTQMRKTSKNLNTRLWYKKFEIRSNKPLYRQKWHPNINITKVPNNKQDAMECQKMASGECIRTGYDMLRMENGVSDQKKECNSIPQHLLSSSLTHWEWTIIPNLKQRGLSSETALALANIPKIWQMMGQKHWCYFTFCDAHSFNWDKLV